MTEPAAARPWTLVLLAGAAALALGGDVAGNFRPEPSGAVDPDTPLPVPLEPEGELPAPPTVFRWTPGGDDVDLAQVVLFSSNYEVFWQSGPLEGPPLEIVPEEVFAGIPAGEPLAWRVREVARGRPRAASRMVVFSFTVDAHGRPIGESVPANPFLPIR